MDYPIAHVLPYIAGLVDGEGCITISKRGQPIFRLAMYAKGSLEIVADIFGGGISQMQRSDNKPLYQYTLTGTNLQGFLLTIKEYLVVKRPEADLVTEFMGNRTSYKGGQRIIPEQERQLRIQYYNRMQELLNRYRRIK